MDINTFLIIVLAINVVTFLIYGLDKFLAKKQMYRISEKMLLTLALCLGGLGAFAGMQIFRHKTKKPIFYIGVPFLIFINCISVYYIFKYIIK